MPSRRTTWLVLRHAGQVLLERRPSPGIWGGLWSFPESSGKDIADACRNLGYAVSSMKEMDAIEHGFTHFRLTIQPVLCEVSRTASRAEAPGRLWLDIEDAGTAATPAPVKKLLVTFRETR
jgi:A/G-specific adenine glycosylase